MLLVDFFGCGSIMGCNCNLFLLVSVTTMEIFSIAMAIYESRKDEFDLIMANVELNNTTDLESIKEIIRTKKTPIIREQEEF